MAFKILKIGSLELLLKMWWSFKSLIYILGISREILSPLCSILSKWFTVELCIRTYYWNGGLKKRHGWLAHTRVQRSYLKGAEQTQRPRVWFEVDG